MYDFVANDEITYSGMSTGNDPFFNMTQTRLHKKTCLEKDADSQVPKRRIEDPPLPNRRYWGEGG